MATHSYKPGDRVTVVNSTIGGRYFVEGKAVIQQPIAGDDEQYMLLFDNQPAEDSHWLERFVSPAAQADPEGFVDQLNAAIDKESK